jgi:uncharacterized protein YcbX
MGLIRTAFAEDENGTRVVRVYAKDYPDSINLPLSPTFRPPHFYCLLELTQFSQELLKKLSYMPSDVDIWGAAVLPYDMGDEYSSFFSKFLGVECKLGYVNAARPRYIQGALPPSHCQNGKHPQTALSDGAPYLYPPPSPLANMSQSISGSR